MDDNHVKINFFGDSTFSTSDGLLVSGPFCSPEVVEKLLYHLTRLKAVREEMLAALKIARPHLKHLVMSSTFRRTELMAELQIVDAAIAHAEAL